MTSKPATIPQYVEWLKRDHHIDVRSVTKTYFESVSQKLGMDFETSDLWRRLMVEWRNYDEEYLILTGYHLFRSLDPPPIDRKPHTSFLLKTFRKNVLENTNWPSEPSGGWFLPGNWFSRVGDVVRTRFAVRYLDGVEYFVKKLDALAQASGMGYEVSYEAREEGYYAAHIDLSHESEVPRIDWDTERIGARVEIQITTQLQEIIQRLLHGHYERRRERTDTAGGSMWQWNYKSDEFATNYLGHILHYVEGMIMEIRERQSVGRATGHTTHPTRADIS